MAVTAGARTLTADLKTAAVVAAGRGVPRGDATDVRSGERDESRGDDADGEGCRSHGRPFPVFPFFSAVERRRP